MSAAVWWAIVAVVEFGGLVAVGTVLIVSRRQLASTRLALERAKQEKSKPRPRRPRPRRPGVAPLAIKTVWETADSLINKGIGATVRNSFEDLAGWARVERPDLARMVADGDVVIAFSDIERSTELNEKLGDLGWVKLLERHNKLINKQVEAHGGHVIKTQGDGFMMAFPDPAQAVRCSIAIQRALQADPERWENIRVRMGLHVGSSVRRGDDLFGRNVAMAARVAGQAKGGEILVSEAIREAIAHAGEIALGPQREVELKGLSGMHEIYPVVVMPAPLALDAPREQT
ncbi:adenylate/guanylate cyclase domain-containing protein [Mycobacterium intermedium]|uniref:Adenylate/guanylate cyclase domain-containing protein n=1 Tax=Mycobacterium intermedium TaxID=28445 RepID=A0A1E3SNM5_MYCIE|nr:adenylate/guanylate cyclase domain-containing protein [Mycobacterium intermedium]MCV6964707.1 adenylate/guanylate cyclase domain-containing protein [Mycobacterium intermedium]ODR03118.1 cyclase [Mycobacterium intermedium]OPE45602.1 adenylate/guanylate cyclase domain-containing protein [Mycobacterium intermedium]ORB06851.1 adenylate/guanylate cyclase domain-containing protein [Mycobacterium intermedium]